MRLCRILPFNLLQIDTLWDRSSSIALHIVTRLLLLKALIRSEILDFNYWTVFILTQSLHSIWAIEFALYPIRAHTSSAWLQDHWLANFSALIIHHRHLLAKSLLTSPLVSYAISSDSSSNHFDCRARQVWLSIQSFVFLRFHKLFPDRDSCLRLKVVICLDQRYSRLGLWSRTISILVVCHGPWYGPSDVHETFLHTTRSTWRLLHLPILCDKVRRGRSRKLCWGALEVVWITTILIHHGSMELLVLNRSDYSSWLLVDRLSLIVAKARLRSWVFMTLT